MDELIYNTLKKYFDCLRTFGFVDIDNVYKVIAISYLQELVNSSMKYFITENDCRLMQETLYTLTGSTCLISFPYQRCSCGGSSSPVTPVPSITSFTLDIPTTVAGNKTYSGNRVLTFAITNSSYVKADTLAVIDVTNNKTLVSGLSITSPVTTDLGSIALVGGNSYKYKISVTGTNGTTYYSPVYTINCTEVVPSITDFAVDITSPIIGSTSIAGSKNFTFKITNPDYVKAGSLSLYVGDTLIASGLSITSPVSQTVNISMTTGNTYSFKATIIGTNGTTYTSNTYNVVCKAVSTVYYGEITTADELTESNITASSSVDGSTTKTFNAPWATKVGQFVAIPSQFTLKTIINSVIQSDIWYNSSDGTSIYTEKDMTINNTIYKVYYSIKPLAMGEDGIVTIQ